MNHFWFKGRAGLWECTFHKSYAEMGPLKYSGPKAWLENAENRMAGKPDDDTLSFKREAEARNLIWC